MSENKVIMVSKKIDWDYYESNYESLLMQLYEGRREHIKGLHNKKVAVTSLAAGLLLQEIVENELQIKPAELVVQKNRQGKPYIEACPEFEYNISHSNDMVVIGYGSCPVGVDVELIRYRDKDITVAKKFFAEEEYNFIFNDSYWHAREEREYLSEEKFFMVWTMKEAYLKYLGTGIDRALNSFIVLPYEKTVLNENVKMEQVIDGGYVYTVCSPADCEIELNIK